MELRNAARSSALDTLAQVCLKLAAASLIALAGVQGWQVFARYVLNAPPSWTEPFSLLLMNVTMFLGAAAGVHTEAHFGFFIAVESAPAKLRRALNAISRVVIASIGALIAVWGAVLVRDGWDINVAGAPLSQGLSYVPLVAGGSMIVLFSLGGLVRAADGEADTEQK
jgi:TRAP-type C4-dicarboxylate transport system permease small subunit